MVILSPGLDPQEFCQKGYAVSHVLDIGAAGDFPADVILKPVYGFPEPDIEPDEGLLVEQFKSASRVHPRSAGVHDDDWLESAYEDRVSGDEE